MMAQIHDRLFGLAGAADLLQVSDTRLRQLIENGQLAATKVSRSWVIRESDLIDFAEKDRRRGRPRLYEAILLSGDRTAHIGNRGGGLETLCGLSPSTGIVHRIGEATDLMGTTMCPHCSERAPRYIVRYWRERGVG